MSRPTRRQLLAGLGAVSAVGIGARALGGRESGFVRSTYAQSTDPTSGQTTGLRVAWYETYDGAVRESHAGSRSGPSALDDPSTYVDSFDGTLLTLSNLLPGDAGAVVVGLTPDGDAPVDVWFRLLLVCRPEGGVVEPESVAGDVPGDDRGELADALDVLAWHDVGVPEGSLTGGCDGRFGFLGVDEPRILVGTPAAPVGADAYAGHDPAAGLLLDLGRNGSTCLEPGAHQCVGLRWSLPASTGDAVQTDGVGVLLQFVPVECGATGGDGQPRNPFADGDVPGADAYDCEVNASD